MAARTVFNATVETNQGVSGFGMIERRRIPAHQPKILSLMLRVAARTITHFVAMKTPTNAATLAELFVAGETPIRFDTLARRVAGETVGESGEARMHVAERPRRDEKVELLAFGTSGCGKRHEASQCPLSHHHLRP